jgi:hypothetical protein
MSGHIARQDVARVRDSLRFRQAHMAAYAAGHADGYASAAAEGFSEAYGSAADDLDRLLGEDTRPPATQTGQVSA